MIVTEQLYIHAKCMIVDDRIAIIGSANINERSMLGDRDSECAAIVRDTDMLWSTMNGEPYLVGRFPHTLRMRLMREHLGVDVDAVMEEELEHEAESHPTQGDSSRRRSSDADSHPTASVDNETEQAIVASRHKLQDELIAKSDQLFSFNHNFEWQQSGNPKVTEDKRVTGNAEHRKDVQGKGFDHMLDESNRLVNRGRDSVVLGGHREVLVLDIAPEGHGTLTSPSPSLHEHTSERGKGDVSPRSSVPSGAPRAKIHDSGFLKPQQPAAAPPPTTAATATEAGADADSASAKTNKSAAPPQPPPLAAEPVNSLVADMKRPVVDKDCMRDPLSDIFHHDVWHTVAENNTRLFRLVFRCMPDNLVQTWKKYKEYAAYGERFAQAQGAAKSKLRMQQESVGRTGPPGTLSVAEKIATLSPIGEMVGGSGIVEKAFEKVTPDKSRGKTPPPPPSPTPPSLHEKKDGSAHVRGNAAEPATNDDDTQRANTERGEKTASQEPTVAHGVHEISKPGADAAINEKAALAGAAAAEQQQQPAAKPAGEEGDGEKPQRYSSLSATNQTTTATAPADSLGKNSNSQRRRKRGGTRSSRRDFTGADELMDKAEAEELMDMVQGHLVLWPYDW
jgi:phospholipase D1/2